MPLDAKIEAVLFWKGESVTFKKLSEILEVREEDVAAGLKTLEQNLYQRGIQLICKDNEVLLGTSPEVSPFIEKLTKEELLKDIGKAGLETLSIILYQGPVARRDIEYVRGVNSNFILRNLLIRGLIERVEDSRDPRIFLYKPTFELLQYLGLKKIEELPEYIEMQQEIKNHEQEN